jgi:hypothetical protein
MQFGSQLDGEVAAEGWKLSIFNPLLSDLHVLDPIFNKGASRPDEFPGGKTQKLHFRAPRLAICLFSFFHYFVWPTKFVFLLPTLEPARGTSRAGGRGQSTFLTAIEQYMVLSFVCQVSSI